MIDALEPVAVWWLRWMFAAAWQLGVMVAIVVVLERVLPATVPAGLRHGLWLLVGLRLVIPPVIPVALTKSSAPLAAAATIAPPVPPPTPFLTMALMAVWLAGVLVFSIVIAARYRRFRRVIAATSRPAPARIEKRAARVAARLGIERLPDVRVSRGDDGPLVTGCLCPRIVLPREAELWDPFTLDHVLCHELAHVARRDLWLEVAWTALSILYWFHPLIHFARRRAYDAREMSCDATAARSAGAGYRATLVRLAARRYLGEQRVASPLLRWGAPGLMQRLRALENARTVPTRKASLGTAATLAVVAAGMLTLTTPCSGTMSVEQQRREAARIAAGALANEPGLGSLHARHAVLWYASLQDANRQ